jgi:hypothetical protein
MKEIRLEKMVSEKAFNFILHWYKEAKKTQDIRTILAFKSFVRRMIEAQEEYHPNGQKIWTDIDNYISTVLSNKEHLCYFRYTDTLRFIVGNTCEKDTSPFGYTKEKDFLKLL